MVIERRIVLPLKPSAAPPQPSEVRCRHCNKRILTARVVYCSYDCEQAAIEGEPPRVAA